MKYLFVLLIVVAAAFGNSAQAICDLNGDGLDGGISDLILLMNTFLGSPEEASACGWNCNPDGDDDSLTIADLALFSFYLSDPDSEPPVYTFRPDDDTLSIESAQAAPGDRLYLPLYLNTIDTLLAYEMLINVDDRYLSIESFTTDIDDPGFYFVAAARKLHVYYIKPDGFSESDLIPPGQYHLGEIEVAVNSDIEEPVTTYITFSTCPDDNFHTGLANITYFVPVLQEGVVTINPTGIQDEPNNLPVATSIDAYPNPFNSSVNIVVQSAEKAELLICDVLGREINRYAISEGTNTISWSGVDSDNKPVNSGIYFAKLQGISAITKKLLLVK